MYKLLFILHHKPSLSLFQLCFKCLHKLSIHYKSFKMDPLIPFVPQPHIETKISAVMGKAMLPQTLLSTIPRAKEPSRLIKNKLAIIQEKHTVQLNDLEDQSK